MSFPLLASLGVRLDKENLYTNLLAAVKEKNLGRDVITNQFVSEISDAMGKRAQGHSVQTSGLMTAKQACHILALMVDQVKFPSEDSITKQIRTQLWHKRDLDKLKGMLKEGLVQPGNPWPILEKVFPSAGPAGEEEAVKAKIPRLDQHLPFMSAAGFQGSCVEEVVKWLESWQPDNEQLQNGLIDEFIGNFDTPAAVTALATAILRAIAAKCDIDTELKKNIRRMFVRTGAAWKAAGGSASDRWLFLSRLENDPALYEIPTASLQVQLAARISSRATGSDLLGCDRQGCQNIGDFRLCKVI